MKVMLKQVIFFLVFQKHNSKAGYKHVKDVLKATQAVAKKFLKRLVGLSSGELKPVLIMM